MAAGKIMLVRADDPESDATARSLLREYVEAIATDLEYQGFAAELASLPAPYVAPGGVLFVAYAGSDVAGCIGLRSLDRHSGEMKRLYVRPAYRRRGLGKYLVESVIRAARQAGYRELRLDTLPGMGSAQALYRRLGFVEIPPYNNPHLPGTRFYALRLSTPTA
jgi:ribosomal protein S18 acetylase RimI-like enzyme